MEFMEDVGVVGFEDGKVWLPSHVLDEAFEPKDSLVHPHHHHPHRSRRGRDAVSPVSQVPQLRRKLHTKPRVQANRASGGPGMQAIFLDSSQKSCGTGFFLPRKIGNNAQLSRKPACLPLLIPSRVVQALNLNVHALESPLTTPQSDSEHNLKRGIRNSSSNRDDENELESVRTQSSVILQDRREEIFLPKEWSY